MAPATLSSSTSSRSRLHTIARACDRCSRQKVKCDGKSTCSRCRHAEQVCHYSPAKKRGPPKGCVARGGRHYPSSGLAATLSASAIPAGNAERSVFSSPRLPLRPEWHVQSAKTADDTPGAGLYAASSSASVGRAQEDEYGSEADIEEVVESEEIIESVMAIYQGFVHPHWPVITMANLSSPRALQQKEEMLFNAIMASAAVTKRKEGEAEERAAHDLGWAPERVSRHFERLTLRQMSMHRTPNRAVIQCIVHLSALHIGRGHYSQAWIDIGTAARAAQDLQLHRKGYRRTTPAERAAYKEDRRIFWCVFVIDKILSVILQRPPALRAAECDVDLPDTQGREEYDIWLTDWTSSLIHPANTALLENLEVHTLSSFRAWCEIMIQLESILQPQMLCAKAREKYGLIGRNSLPSEHEDEQVSSGAGLEAWKRRLPEHLNWDSALLRCSSFFKDGLVIQQMHDYFDDAIICHRGVGPQVHTLRAWYCVCNILHLRCSPNSSKRASVEMEEVEIFRLTTKRSFSQLHIDSIDQGYLEASQPFACEICAILTAYESTFGVHHIPAQWCYLVFQAALIHLLTIKLCKVSTIKESNPRTARQLVAFTQSMLDMCTRWLDIMSAVRETAGHHISLLKSLDDLIGAELDGIARKDDEMQSASTPLNPRVQQPDSTTGGWMQREATAGRTEGMRHKGGPSEASLRSKLGAARNPTSRKTASDTANSFESFSSGASARSGWSQPDIDRLQSHTNSTPAQVGATNLQHVMASNPCLPSDYERAEVASLQAMDSVPIWDALPISSEDLHLWHQFFEPIVPETPSDTSRRTFSAA